MSLKDGYKRPNQLVFKAPVREKKSVVVNGIDLLENVPPRTENEVSAIKHSSHLMQSVMWGIKNNKKKTELERTIRLLAARGVILESVQNYIKDINCNS